LVFSLLSIHDVSLPKFIDLVVIFKTSPSSSKREFRCQSYCVFCMTSFDVFVSPELTLDFTLGESRINSKFNYRLRWNDSGRPEWNSKLASGLYSDSPRILVMGRFLALEKGPSSRAVC
jgi:hypothetical protein